MIVTTNSLWQCLSSEGSLGPQMELSFLRLQEKLTVNLWHPLLRGQPGTNWLPSLVIIKQ
jgi:hypothetical protein